MRIFNSKLPKLIDKIMYLRFRGFLTNGVPIPIDQYVDSHRRVVYLYSMTFKSMPDLYYYSRISNLCGSGIKVCSVDMLASSYWRVVFKVIILE